MKRIQQTFLQQTSNQSAIQNASAFPRRHAEFCGAEEKLRVWVAAMIAADAFSLTLAWIGCMLFFQIARHPSPLGTLVQSLITLPLTLAIFGRNGLYPAFGMERAEEVKRVVLCITGVQAGCVSASWLLHAAGGLPPASVLGSLSMVLVPIGRLLISDVMRKKGWWSGVYSTGVVGETEHALEFAPEGAEFGSPEAAGTFGRIINSQDNQKRPKPFFTIWKRLMDVPIALIGGVVLLPLIVTIIAAVKLTSQGRIFYGHLRVGRNNTSFRVWKFRTMVTDADAVLAERLAIDRSLQIEWQQNQKLRKDPRLTPVGNSLRRYSLDELPQLWNVIKGEMSIVGPRPITKAEIPKYAEHFADYTKVLPGITGLWQVSGRNETTYEQRVLLDSYYINNWSPLLDLFIMFRTVKAVVSARGAY